MTDLSGHTLTLTRPTTDAPALIPFTEWREQRRLEREAWRLDRFRRARDLDRAAIESLTRPAPVVPKPPKPTKPKSTRKPGNQLKTFPCPDCARMTRGASTPERIAPGTIRRREDGKCKDCSDLRVIPPNSVRPCAGCGTPTRPAGAPPIEDTPTVQRRKAGKCSTCITGGRKPRAPKIAVEVLVADYQAGMSTEQIATKYGMHRSNVCRHLGRAGVFGGGK